MPRPATGSPRWNPTAKRWEARVSIPGRGREPIAIDVPPCLYGTPGMKCACSSCSQARRVAKIISDRSRNDGRANDDARELASEWFARYVDLHASLGNGTAQHDGDWKRYVEPHTGNRPLTTWTPDDVKAIRDGLTKARLAGKIGAKRCMNVWSTVVTAPLSRAFTDDDPKYTSVRVGPAASNPATSIKPPVTKDDQEEDERERQPLDPHEGFAVLSCAAVPIEDRRFYAWGMLTGLRPAELYGLTWEDVRANVIKVQRARDMKTAEDTDTKTRASVRDVPIHPHLAPLIEATRGKGRVFNVDRVRDVEGRPAVLRVHLTAAGVDRPELHDGTTTLMPFDVRSFRTTFATWCARSGFDSAWIDAWLGHAPKTTSAKHYVKDTGAMTSGVFPVVPDELLGRRSIGSVLDLRASDSESLRCEGRDLNPTIGRSQMAPENARSPAKIGPTVTGDCSVHATVLDGNGRPEPSLDARTLALAAAVEALAEGHARVLAAELRARLEALAGPIAEVVPLTAQRRTR